MTVGEPVGATPHPAYSSAFGRVSPVAQAARSAACAALLGAAVIHATVVAEHAEEWRPAGFFFVLLEMVEMTLGIALLAVWGRAAAIAVAVTSLGTVVVWVVSRTSGIPVGPPSFQHPEAVGTPDLASCVLELAAAVAVLPRALGRVRSRPSGRVGTPRRTAALLVVAAAAVTVWGLSGSLGGPADAEHSGPHAGAAPATTSLPTQEQVSR
jgi:hypothetical protein